jgi:serine/threonine-protein kinase
VKVLDFGLAAVLHGKRSGVVDPEESPTLTMEATQAGMIMGTAAYMSPEQASGKAVDRRADIWSFGVVLFEMLTGKLLFSGDTVAQTLADVLLAPIDQIALQTRPLRFANCCGDAWMRSQNAATISAMPVARCREYRTNPAADALPRRPAANRQVAGAALMLFGVWQDLVGTVPRTVRRPLVHLDVDLGSEVLLGSESGVDVIISPDGARLVFVSKGRLFTRASINRRPPSWSGPRRKYSVLLPTGNGLLSLVAEG